MLLFAFQGDEITSRPLDVARIALPLLAYFALMWLGSLLASRAVGLDYAHAATVAFTAAGNNFELAIAVAIGTYGITSGQALAGVVGPLIEVPILVGLVYVSLWLAPKLFPIDPPSCSSASPTAASPSWPARGVEGVAGVRDQLGHVVGRGLGGGGAERVALAGV